MAQSNQKLHPNRNEDGEHATSVDGITGENTSNETAEDGANEGEATSFCKILPKLDRGRLGENLLQRRDLDASQRKWVSSICAAQAGVGISTRVRRNDNQAPDENLGFWGDNTNKEKQAHFHQRHRQCETLPDGASTRGNCQIPQIRDTQFSLV